VNIQTKTKIVSLVILCDTKRKGMYKVTNLQD